MLAHPPAPRVFKGFKKLSVFKNLKKKKLKKNLKTKTQKRKTLHLARLQVVALQAGIQVSYPEDIPGAT